MDHGQQVPRAVGMAGCCSPFQDVGLNYSVLFDHDQEKRTPFSTEVPQS